jgi:hypothetical protein
MPRKRMLAYIPASVNEDLLHRIEYLLEPLGSFALRRRRGANCRYAFGIGAATAEFGFRAVR